MSRVSHIAPLSTARVRELLIFVCARNADLVDSLLGETSPSFFVDRKTIRANASAELGPPNLICIGEHWILGLEAIAYASSIVLSVRTHSSFARITVDELRPQLAPADELWTWATKRDIQSCLSESPHQFTVDELLPGKASSTIDIVSSLNDEQRIMGLGLFRYSLGFVLLHEIAHLRNGDSGCSGFPSILQERTADLDAASWMTSVDVPGASSNKSDRHCALFGIAIGLIWLTCREIFLGPVERVTHPNSFDRLYQTLERNIDPSDPDEGDAVWFFVTMLLVIHMNAAGFEFSPDPIARAPQEATSHLIDRISRAQRKCD